MSPAGNRRQEARDKCKGGMRVPRMTVAGGWQRASTAGDIIDKWVEMPSLATPFAAGGMAETEVDRRGRVIVLASMELLVER